MVATPTCLPSLSLSTASAESGALSAGALAHPASTAATPSSRSGLTVECPPVSVELPHELLRLVPEPRDVLELDVLVATDLVRQLGQGPRRLVGDGREPDQRRLEELPVLADQGPLHAPHL